MKTCPLESSICLSICLAWTRLTNTLRPTNSYFSFVMFVCIWIIIFVQSSIYWLVMLYIVFMVNIYDSIVIFSKQKGPDFGLFYYHTNFWVFLSFSFFFVLLFAFVVWVWLFSFFQSFAFTSLCGDLYPSATPRNCQFLKKISFSCYTDSEQKVLWNVSIVSSPNASFSLSTM